MISVKLASLAVLISAAYAATVGHDMFSHRIAKGQLRYPALNDISGMAASRVYPGIVYVHNYQGDGNYIYAINVDTATLVATYVIQGAQNFDWEDIAYGPCADDCRQAACSAGVTPQRYCLYISDTGSHGGVGAADIIYMVREPSLNDSTIPVVDKLVFSWSEPDAESLIVTPEARLFIISKIYTGRAMIAELPDAGWGGNLVTLDLAKTGVMKVTTTHNDPQGADLSPDGKELLLVAEEEVFYYNVPDGDFIKAFRTMVPESVYSYVREPNTEGISWTPDGKGFHVIAREDNPFVYYYAKDDTSGPGIGR